MNLEARTRKLGVLDTGLIKWSAIFFALFAVAVWPEFAEWVLGTHWGWFLGASLLLAVKPTYTFFSE